MISPSHADVVVDSENGDSGRTSSVIYIEAACNVHWQKIRLVTERLHSNIGQSQSGLGQTVRLEFAGGDPVCREAQRIDDIGAEEVRATDREGLGHGVNFGSRIPGRA